MTSKGQEITEQAKPWEKLISEISGIAKMEREGGASRDVAVSVINGIAQAGSIEDIFDENEKAPRDLREVDSGTVFNVVDVAYWESAEQYRESGFGFYCVMTSVDANGATELFSTGAPNLVASIRRAQSLGYCNDEKPFTFRLVKSPTRNGELFKAMRP